nr:hypothetical protein [uncultured Oribacterium sp.]
MQEEESFIEAYLMELEAEKEVEIEEDKDEDNETIEKSEAEDESEADVELESEEEIEEIQEPEPEEEPERIPDFEEKSESEDTNLLPARGTCRRKPLRNCYREEKGVQRNSWRKEKCKWRLS